MDSGHKIKKNGKILMDPINPKKFFFLAWVNLYSKMYRIKFYVTFKLGFGSC